MRNTTLNSKVSSGANISLTGPVTVGTAGTTLTMNAGTGTISVAGVVGSAGMLIGDVTLTSDDIDLSGGAWNWGPSSSVYFYTSTATRAMNIGYSGSGWSLDDSEITSAFASGSNGGTIVFGRSGTQSGPITFQTADFYLPNSGAGVAVIANSDASGGSGTVTFDTNASLAVGTALKLGTEALTVNAYSGIYAAEAPNSSGHISTTGTITLNLSSGGSIGTGTLATGVCLKPIEVITATATTPNVTVSGSAPDGVWLMGVGTNKPYISSASVSGYGVITSLYTGGIIYLTTNITNNTGAALTYSGPVEIRPISGAGITINTNGYSISFSQTLDEYSGNPAGTDSLTIVAGSGSVTFTGAVGGSKAINNLTISSASNVTISGGIATAGTGAVSINHTGVLSIADKTSDSDTATADLNLTGSFAETDTSGSPTGTVQIAGDITTAGSNAITFNRPVTLTGNVLLSSGSGAIAFQTAAKVDGDGTSYNDLHLATTGSASFGLALGATTRLTALDVSAQTISLANIGTSSAVGSSGTVQLAATSTISANGTQYRSTGAQTWTAASGENIEFLGGNDTSVATSNAAFSVVNSGLLLNLGAAKTLNVTTLGGAISVAGAIDGTAGESFAFSSTGGTTNTISLGSSVGSGGKINAVSLVAPASITLTGNISTNAASGNNVTMTGPVLLAADVAVSTGGANYLATSNNISFSSSIDSKASTAHSLSLDAHSSGAGATVGNVTVSGSIGATTALSSLTVAGNAVSLKNIGSGSVGISGATNVTAYDANAGATLGSITLGGTIYNTTGLQSYTVPAVANSLAATAGSATSFAMAGSSFTTSGAKMLLSTGTNLSVVTGGGAISMQPGIAGSATNTHDTIALNAGSSTVDVGPIGTSGSNDINTLAVTGSGGITLRGDVYLDANANNSATFTGPVAITANRIIQTGDYTTAYAVPTHNSVSFSSTINGASSGETLTVNASASGKYGEVFIGGVIGGSVTLGAVALNGNVVSAYGIGSASQVGAASIAATTANPGSHTPTITLDGASGVLYRTSGTQSWNATSSGTITLGSNDVAIRTLGNTIALTGAVGQNGKNFSLDSTDNANSSYLTGANITVNQTVDNGGSLTLNAGTSGTAKLSGLVGGTASLGAMSLTGNKLSLYGVGNSTRVGASSITATGVGATPQFTLDGASGVFYRSNGAQAWNATSSGSILLGSNSASVFTQGASIAFTGAVNQNAKSLTVDSTDNANSSYLAGANLTFNQSVDNGGSLTIDAGSGGIAQTLGLIGGTTPLSGNLGISGLTVKVFGWGSVASTGTGVAGTVTVTALGGGTGTISLTGSSYHSTLAQTWAAGTGASGNTITLNGGAATSILTNGSAVSLTGLVNQNGNSLTVDTTSNSNPAGNSVTFNQTIDGVGSLTVNSGTGGTAAVTGAIGASASVTSVSVTGKNVAVYNVGTSSAVGATTTVSLSGTSSVSLSGQQYNSTGAQAYTGPVVMDASGTAPVSVAVKTAGASGANIGFSSTILDNSSGNHSLSIDPGASGTVTVSGDIGTSSASQPYSLTIGGASAGGTIALAQVYTTKIQSYRSTGTITLNGANYQSSSAAAASPALLFYGPVLLANNVTWKSNGSSTDGITLTGTVDADNVANSRMLSLDSGSSGTINFSGSGNVGSGAALNALTLTNSGGATFSGSVTVTAGTTPTLTLTNTTGTIDFKGNLTATNIATANQAYNLVLEGPGASTITNAADFRNTGTLTLGLVSASGSILNFVGGIATSNATSHPSRTYLTGTVNTTDQAASLLALTIQGSANYPSTINTKGSSGAAISIATLDGAQDLYLTAGSGAISFSGAVGSGTALGYSGSAAPALSITTTNATGATFSSTLSTNSGINVTGNSVFKGDVTIGAGSQASFLNGNVTLYKPSTTADLIFSSANALSFGDDSSASTTAGTYTIKLDGVADSTHKIEVTTTSSGSKSAAILFNGPIAMGTQAQSINVTTSAATTGSRLVTMNGDAAFTATPYSAYALRIAATNLILANNISISSANQDIIFLIDSALNLGGTSVAVSTGTGNFQIAPLTATRSIEFAPVSTGIGNLFVDSRFGGVTAGSFILGQSTQTGAIYMGNSTNANSSIKYALSVLQQQSGAGKIQFENHYDSSVVGKSLTLTSGTGGVQLGNSVASLAISLGSGAFTSNGNTSYAGCGAVVVAQSTTITANGGIAFLTANSTINDSSTGTHTLTLTVGGTPTAGIELDGVIGGASALGNLAASVAGSSYKIAAYNATTTGSQTWSALGGMTLNGTSYSSTGTASADTLSFTGDVTYKSASGLTVQTSATTSGADAITFANKILAVSDGLGPLSILPGSAGSLTVVGDIGSSSGSRPSSVTLGVTGNTGAYAITNLYSTSSLTDYTSGVTTVNGSAMAISGNGAVSFSGGVEISTGLTVATDGASGSDITLGSFIRTNAAGSHYDLSLQAGASGAVTVNGLIGAASGGSGKEIKSLSIDTATAPTALVTLNGAYTTGPMTIGYSASTQTGAVHLSPTSVVTSYQTFTSGSGAIQVYGPVVLSNASGSITLQTAGGSVDNVILSQTVNPTATTVQGLTLIAGSGSITVGGAIGSYNSSTSTYVRLGALTLTSAASATFNGGVYGTNFTQTAGTGTTSFNGAQDYTGNFAFAGTGLTVNAAWTIGGTTTVTNSGVFTTASGSTTAALTSVGSFTQSGGGTNSLGSDITVTTSGTTPATISFTNPIALSSDVIWTTADGSVSTATTATIDSATSSALHSLAIAAGAGQITLLGDIGTGTESSAPTRLSSLSATSTSSAANAIYIKASVLSTGAQTYNGFVTLGDATSAYNAIVVNGSSGLVTFNKAVTHNAGTIQAGAVAAGSDAIRFVGDYSAMTTAGVTTALVGSSSTNPDIEFDANAYFATFMHNGDELVFKGSALQTFDSNDQLIGDIVVDNSAAGLLITQSVNGGSGIHQTGGSYTTKIASGYLDLQTNSASVGWVADSAAGTAVTVGSYRGIAGTLSFASGTNSAARELRLPVLYAGSGYAISSTESNTITASGDVTIAGSFTSSTANATDSDSGQSLLSNLSTLVMTGASKSLTASPTIGNLTVASSASVTLGSALSMDGNMLINGSLDVSSGSYQISLAGNWDNEGSFASQAGTVQFTKATGRDSGIIMVSGANDWHSFYCHVPGIKIWFQNGKTQRMTSGGYFDIVGDSSNYITISRQTSAAKGLDQTSDLDWVLPSAPTASKMWQIDIMPGADVTMSYVTVCYSDARSHPVAKPDNVDLYSSPDLDNSPSGEIANTCYQWITGVMAIYSYMEDSDGNGKLDRIRIVAQTTLNGDFSGFTAAVTGYDIDTSKGTKGFKMVPSGETLPSSPHLYGGSGYEFFIYLKEKGYTDTGTVPDWNIATNTSLKDSSTQRLKLKPITGMGSDELTTPMPTYSCALPRIAYTLALPGKNQVFFHFSGSVYSDSAGTALSSSSFKGASSMDRITSSSDGTSEALVTYSDAIGAAAIAQGSTDYPLAATVYDNQSTPHDYANDDSYLSLWQSQGALPPMPYNSAMGAATWPNAIASTSHRVSDVMISLPPPVSTSSSYDSASYFAWPIYAKDNITLTLSDSQIASLTAEQSAAHGIGLIRSFDGSQWLRPQDITLQTRVSSALGTAYQPTLIYDTNVASTYIGTGGSWLPTHAETAYSGFDSYPNTGVSTLSGAKSAATNLWNITLPSTDSKISGQSNGAVFGFYYRLATSPSDLYVARLAITDPSKVPTNWYRYVRPFAFSLHSTASQKGGVTILNNVIDPTKGETVKLDYTLATAGAVTATVFTLDGDVVARLVNNSMQATGEYVVYWNGKNLGGNPVARGLYFIRIVAPGMDEIRKVLVVRK
jgi:hypothetical protein